MKFRMQNQKNAINIHLISIYVHHVIKLRKKCLGATQNKSTVLQKLICKYYETDMHKTRMFSTFIHAKFRKKLN